MESGIKELSASRGPQVGDVETIELMVDKILYHDNFTHYTIGKGTIRGTRKQVTFIGEMLRDYLGCYVCMTGTWVESQYGMEFEISFAHICYPKTLYEIRNYLHQLNSVEEKTAEKIVSYFGKETIDVILDYTRRLIEIKHITEKKAHEIYAEVQVDMGLEELNEFLNNRCGLDSKYTLQIYKSFAKNSDEAKKLINKNPYCLMKVPDVSFTMADQVALKLGVESTNPVRIREAVLYLLRSEADNAGHVYLIATDLVRRLDENLLHIGDSELIINEIISMWRDGKLQRVYFQRVYFRRVYFQRDDNPWIHAIYLPEFFVDEQYCAKKLVLLQRNNTTIPEDALDLSVSGNGFQYTADQINAVKTAMNKSVMVLTGGPGTGKTTVTRAIINTMYNAGLSVLCAAPTGRAAKRLEETTGTPAQTIHRLLHYIARTETFDVNEHNPLACDALIIDEMSMVDICLLAAVLRALPETARLIMIGDADQLASVNAGDVLHDIIDSDRIPVVRLERIHRQGDGSAIIRAIDKIRRGIIPLLDKDKTAELQFVPAGSAAEAAQIIVKELLPQYGMNDVQILTPIQHNTKENDGSAVSAINLNQYAQKILNQKVYIGDTRDPRTYVYCGKKRTFIQGEKVTSEIPEFRVGDKVIQTRNDYNKEVFNGDIGVVIGTIDSDDPGEGRELMVRFDGRDLTYTERDYKDLSLAYAITIHKAQGSEFPVVIVPIVDGIPKSMLQRNLLYTAVSRAKTKLILVGSSRAIKQAVLNTAASRRNSGLDYLIAECHRKTAAQTDTYVESAE